MNLASYLISVIIPVYNGSRFIKRLIDDLNNQNFHSFEVVFIDDGSTDNSYELLAEMIKVNQYKFKCKLIRQANKGVSAARNSGIRNSSGQYLCFVDIDDGLMPGYLSKMYEFIKYYKTDVVFCNLVEGAIKNINENCVVIERDAAIVNYLYGNIKSGACTLMVLKSFFVKHDLWFAEGYKYTEDLHMCWRLIACSTKVGLLKEKLYLYYNNHGSAMNVFDFERYDSVLLIKSLEDYFEVNRPRFFPLFKTYAAARVKWSLLWQAAKFLSWPEYKLFTERYDLKTDIVNLVNYPESVVAFSSRLYLFSEVCFFCAVKVYFIMCMKSKLM